VDASNDVGSDHGQKLPSMEREPRYRHN